MNKLSFFLMSEKGYKSLLYFLRHFDSKHIDFIVCAKDSNVLQDFSDEIVNLAKENGVTYYFRNQEFEIKSKYLIAISWRWIIKSTKDSILITIHDSILPKYRGFSPLVNQLINKEPYIGATAIISNDEYDKGDIIAQNKIKITYPIRVNDAISKIINSYEEIILKICSNIIKDIPFKPVKQNESEASYSLWRNDDDYKIDWNMDANEILNFIYAVGFPFLGASTCFNDQKIRIFDAEIIKDVKIINRDVGKVIFFDERFPVIVCGKGLLKISDAIYDHNKLTIFPLNNFRIRFL